MLTSEVTSLTSAEVAERHARGEVNRTPRRTSRPVSAILRGNFFTLFNTVIGVLFVFAVVFGGFKQGLFGLVIVANAAIGTIQELRAKRTLDKLALVGQAESSVRRDGIDVLLPPEDIVKDDLVLLAPGDKVVVDGPVTHSAGLEIDESLLTGEADPVHKEPGEWVQSGSFVVAGSGSYVAEKIGADSYAAKLVEEASRFSLAHSELRNGINRFIKIITWLIVPVAFLLICSQLIGQAGLSAAIVSTVAGIVPMIPEGLVLLTSIAFAVGVIRLGRRKCLVQELPAIEGLARTDVLCLDKTGTLTEGSMDLTDVIPLRPDLPVQQALAALTCVDDSPNPTMQAVATGCDPAPADWRAVSTMPFSSARKWSGAVFERQGAWLLGAPEMLLPQGDPALTTANDLAADGLRVLALVTADSADVHDGPSGARAAALVTLRQRLRPSAAKTLEYFAEQGVAVKIISGDNPTAAGAVAQSLQVLGAEHPVDARQLPQHGPKLAQALEENSVFGRVSPQQKRQFVHSLQSQGHTVAMTGDGVNDVLALKDADLGVAMGSGSPAARSVAKVVLLDDEFATLPHVVAEGRRVLGNIERVSNLFLTKTVYSIALALTIGVAALIGWIFQTDTFSYPFVPVNITLIGSLTIGIPAFFLALAPTYDRARSGFVLRVLRFAIPAGLVAASATLAAYFLAKDNPESSLSDSQATAAITLFAVALAALALVARPYTWWRLGLVAVMGGAFAIVLAFRPFREFFELGFGHFFNTFVGIGLAVGGVLLLIVFLKADNWMSSSGSTVKLPL